jgi:ParB/RepB/Spo0J family partition protein
MSNKTTPAANQKSVKIRDADIPIELIDDPIRPSRETFDEEKLNELILSIRDAGLIQPISVTVAGERYRVLAGHRRLIACRALHHTTIRARVYPAGTDLAAVVQVHENVIREDLNPAEEASWWWELLETHCGGDTNRLAALLKLSRLHVERKLALKTGDEDVFAALGQGLIGAGVAEELNRVKDRSRRVMYLDAAVRGGATRALIREWRSKGEALDALQGSAAVVVEATAAAVDPLPPPRLACELCDQGIETGAIETMYVHRHCRRSMIDRLLALYQEQRGERNASPPHQP